MTRQKFLISLLFLIAFNSGATGLSYGTGGYWKDVCLGKHDELDKQGAIAACTMLLVGYQAGAAEQARESKVLQTLCRNLDPTKLPNDFAQFVNSNKEYEDKNVLEVLRLFTKSNKCGE